MRDVIATPPATPRGEATTPEGKQGAIENILTFDVEDYHHIVSRNWLGHDMRPTSEVVDCTKRILDILKTFDCKATFFVVGNVAEAFPDLIARIHDDGHELGSHGYDHLYVNQMSRDEFCQDVAKSKHLLESITGAEVLGFRAPQFSIDASTPWAFEILAELGFTYDTSLFPFSGRRYGDSLFPQGPYEIPTEHGTLVEVPLSTFSIWNRRIPVAGGGYLRLFPMAFNEWGMKRINGEGRPVVVYMHPYELECNPRRLQFDGTSLRHKCAALFRHKVQMINRTRSQLKLTTLLSKHRFVPCKDHLKSFSANKYLPRKPR